MGSDNQMIISAELQIIFESLLCKSHGRPKSSMTLISSVVFLLMSMCVKLVSFWNWAVTLLTGLENLFLDDLGQESICYFGLTFLYHCEQFSRWKMVSLFSLSSSCGNPLLTCLMSLSSPLPWMSYPLKKIERDKNSWLVFSLQMWSRFPTCRAELCCFI